jgi:hypothetical protein
VTNNNGQSRSLLQMALNIRAGHIPSVILNQAYSKKVI